MDLTLSNKAIEIILKNYPIPTEVRFHIQAVKDDLEHRTRTTQDSPQLTFVSLEDSVNRIRSWWATQDGIELWINFKLELLATSEPVAGWLENGSWDEPDWEHIYHFDRSDIKGLLFGAALSYFI